MNYRIYIMRDIDTNAPEAGRVEWFAVAINGEIIGRRRTRAEAVALAESRGARLEKAVK